MNGAANLLADAAEQLCAASDYFSSMRPIAEFLESAALDVREYAAEIGWHVAGFTYSPIKGPKGNIEFLADIRPGAGDMPDDAQIAALVREARAGAYRPEDNVLFLHTGGAGGLFAQDWEHMD